jgi:nucleotide-binding universal stress UspA family protein
MPRLSDHDLTYLTEVDHQDHEALVAFDEDSGDIVGVARFVRTGPLEAEPAIVVGDDWQGRGLGTQLMDRLADRAREEGIARFRAPVLSDNEAVLSLLGGLGEHWIRREGNMIEVEIDLAPAPEARPRLLVLLRAAAAGTVSPAITLLDRLGLRARYGPPDRASLANTIVVGIEPDDPDERALGCAAELAPVFGSSVQLVGARRRLLDGEAEAAEALERAARRLRDRGLDVDVHVRTADAVTALVHVAAEQRARLVIVGAARPDSPRLLPGDVPGAVARQAPCDVLIAR